MPSFSLGLRLENISGEALVEDSCSLAQFGYFFLEFADLALKRRYGFLLRLVLQLHFSVKIIDYALFLRCKPVHRLL